MPARIIPFPIRPDPRPGPVPPPVPARPAAAAPSRSRPHWSRRPVLGVFGPVMVEWDACRGLPVAVCARCCESFDALDVDQADRWAADHTCDPELAALLAAVTRGRVA